MSEHDRTDDPATIDVADLDVADPDAADPGAAGIGAASVPADTCAGEPARPVLRGYRVARYLGGGANGMVWAVVRDSDQARLAAKVLLSDVDDACAELGLLSRLEHDHVLRLHDSLIDDSGPNPRLVLVTELAEGGSLGEAIRGRGHLSLGEMVTVLTPLARTLHDLHGQGLVHGDLHPDNVLLTGIGKPVLADFGQARMVCAEEADLWGTPGFVAPEMLAGAAAGPEADVFAWGAVAWTCLVGEPPPPAALRPHLQDVAPHADSATCDLVLSCLAHTPQARPAAGELALAVWGLAEAEPAPIPGSVGRRAAPATRDPWSGLTQRIREQASPTDGRDNEDDEDSEERPWHRRAPVGAIAAVAAVAGLACSAFVMWPQGSGEQTARPASTRASTAVPSAPAAARTAVPVGSPATATATATATPGPTSAPTSASATSPSTAQPVREDIRATVQRLADARATAWGRRDPGALAAGLLPESAAWQRDARDLKRAADAGLRYDGLTFTVTTARVATSAPTTMTVDATVTRSGYRVRQERSSAATSAGVPAGTAQPPQAAERTVLTLSRTDQGWRISDWRSP